MGLRRICRHTCMILLFVLLTVACTEPAVQGEPTGQIPAPTQPPGQVMQIAPLQASETATGMASEALACIPTGTWRKSGMVTKVVDGDTIKVDLDGTIYTVRYIGMDTPETVKPNTPVEYFGKEASAKNSQLVKDQTVSLVRDVSETDQYGRLLAYVLVGDIFVNYELAIQGYATSATFPPDVACSKTFQAAERDARENNRGLWAPH
jgi:micrococcal nuclease